MKSFLKVILTCIVAVIGWIFGVWSFATYGWMTTENKKAGKYWKKWIKTLDKEGWNL